MKTINITTRIHNPNITEVIQGDIYESLQEAIADLGENEVLRVLNDDVIRIARYAWRETTIKKLQERQ